MFSEEDRKVFPYHDGENDVFGDPEEIYLALSREFNGDVAGPLERLEQIAREGLGAGGDPKPDYVTPPELALEAAELNGEINARARRAFGMAPYDRRTGRGATEAMCRQVFDDYLAWTDEKKNPPDASPSASPVTAGGDSTPAPEPTPAPSSACG